MTPRHQGLTGALLVGLFLAALVALVLLMSRAADDPASGWCTGNDADWQMGSAPEDVPCSEL